MRLINTESKRVLLFSLVFLLSLSLVGEAVSATEYYVKTDGNDSLDGLTWDTAWQTINHTQANVAVGGGQWYRDNEPEWIEMLKDEAINNYGSLKWFYLDDTSEGWGPWHGLFNVIHIATGTYDETSSFIFNPPAWTRWEGEGLASTNLFMSGYDNHFDMTNDYVGIVGCKLGTYVNVYFDLGINTDNFFIDCLMGVWIGCGWVESGDRTNLYFNNCSAVNDCWVFDFDDGASCRSINGIFDNLIWADDTGSGYFNLGGTGNIVKNYYIGNWIGESKIYSADASISDSHFSHLELWGSSGNIINDCDFVGTTVGEKLNVLKDASADGQQLLTDCTMKRTTVASGAQLTCDWTDHKFYETSNGLWTTITTSKISLVVAGGSSDVVFTERPLAITPSNTMDVLVTTWQTSGDYIKEFNASCAVPAATFTYTIGDMPIDTKVRISTGTGWDSIHTTDGSGQFTGTYDGGWSEKVFAVGLLDETVFSDLNYTPYVDVGDNSTVIRINVSNPSNVTSVWIEENSTGIPKNSSMILESGTNVSGIYNYSLNYSLVCEISFRIYANDSYDQLANTSVYAIFVRDISVSVDSDRPVYSACENITVSGKAILLPDGTNLTDNNITVYLDETELFYNATTGLIEENGNETLSTDSGGNYNYIFSAPSQEGNHTIKVNLTDPNGIYGENETVFDVDMTSQNMTIISPENETALPAGTTQVWINITTDENATCRYNTTDFVYENSTNFTSTGGTNHSFLYTGLSNGNTYNLYYRCNDSYGNINTNSTYHTFSVSVQSAYCGDGICNNGETCLTCLADCGSCWSGSSGSFILFYVDENATNETNETNMSLTEPMIYNMTENTTTKQDINKSKAKEKIDEVRSRLKHYDDKAREKIIEAEAAFGGDKYIDAYNLAVEAENLLVETDDGNTATDEDHKNPWIIYFVLFSLLAVILYGCYRSAPEILGKLKAGNHKTKKSDDSYRHRYNVK